VASIPGLSTAGIDIITSDFKNDPGNILEINTNANFNLNYFTYKGEGQHPLNHWIELLLIKHKLKHNHKLNKNELCQAVKMFKFSELKSFYFSLFSSSDIKFLND